MEAGAQRSFCLLGPNSGFHHRAGPAAKRSRRSHSSMSLAQGCCSKPPQAGELIQQKHTLRPGAGSLRSKRAGDRLPAEGLGRPFLPLPALGTPGVLWLWLHPSDLRLCLSVASPLCVCVSSVSRKDTGHWIEGPPS